MTKRSATFKGQVNRSGDLIPFHRNPITWLISCGVILVILIMIGTVVLAVRFRERAIDDSKRELENTLLLLTRHFDQQLDDCRAIEDDFASIMFAKGIRTAEAYARLGAQEDIHQLLKSKTVAQTYIGAVNLFDSAGNLINSSVIWPVSQTNVSDRAYFKIFKDDPESPQTLLEPLHSRVTGEWTTIIARKLVGPGGEFLGAITRGFSPEHFEKFFASVSLGENSTITVLHRNGTMLARFPHQDALIGKNFSDGPLFRSILAHSDHGTMLLVSPVDGKKRIGSLRVLPRFPVVITATTTEEAVLAGWYQQTKIMMASALLISFIIATVFLLIIRKLTCQHTRSKQQLALQKETLDTAVTNMSQGLILFDSEQHLVMCNNRYLEIYGLGEGSIKPGDSFRDIMQLRKRTGTFGGDVAEYCRPGRRDMTKRNISIVETPSDQAIQIIFQPLRSGGWVSTHEDITDSKRSQEKIEHLAKFDALTDLSNRAMFHERLEEKLAQASDVDPLAVIYIDLDEFKGINDQFGHAVGDELLKVIGARLQMCVRDSDLVARLGGDEFAIIHSGFVGANSVESLLTRIYATVRHPIQCFGHILTTDASIGVAIAPKDAAQIDELLKNADLALYAAKESGRGTSRFFATDMQLKAERRKCLEMDIRNALTNEEFEVHYQPIIALQSGKMSGCEALLRWRHPKRGMISPLEFIPVAEESGLIDQLGEWVLKVACSEATSWPLDLKLAVNISPVQFRNRGIGLKIAGLLAASGLAPGRLELEITEAVLIGDDEITLAILHDLRSLGVRIALDDFGTGYSSLAYIHRFPFDKIKIDQSFIDDLAESKKSASIVKAVVDIALANEIITTAEGVETVAQREILKALGCNQMQGYLFSRAVSATELHRSFLYASDHMNFPAGG